MPDNQRFSRPSDLLRRVALFAAAAVSAVSAAGCMGGKLTVQQAAEPQIKLDERFKLAFAIENQNQPGDGLFTFPNYDIVLFRETPGTDGEITRYVRIRTLWPYLAGLNHTTDSQINCTVELVRADPRGAILYQGAGIVHAVPGGGKFECKLKSAVMALRGRSGEAEDEIGFFELKGKFTALQDPREHAYYVQRFSRVVEHLKQPPAE